MCFVANPHRFTADDAFDASEAGEPILLTEGAVEEILMRHDIDETRMDYEAWCLEHQKDRMDAANLLAWLGY